MTISSSRRSVRVTRKVRPNDPVVCDLQNGHPRKSRPVGLYTRTPVGFNRSRDIVVTDFHYFLLIVPESGLPVSFSVVGIPF